MLSEDIEVKMSSTKFFPIFPSDSKRWVFFPK